MIFSLHFYGFSFCHILSDSFYTVFFTAPRDVSVHFMYTRSGHPVLTERPVLFSRTADFGHTVCALQRSTECWQLNNTRRDCILENGKKYLVYKIVFPFYNVYQILNAIEIFLTHISQYSSQPCIDFENSIL